MLFDFRALFTSSSVSKNTYLVYSPNFNNQLRLN